MQRIGYVLALLFSCQIAFGQGYNVDLLAHVDDHTSSGYTDVWGYEAPDGKEYALLGVNGGVSIVDVSDAANSVEVDFIPYVNFGWYDMKTYQNYCYVTSEGAPDLLIIDLSPLPDSAHTVARLNVFTTSPHNNFIDTERGILFGIEDFNFNNPVRLFSLAFPEVPFEVSSIDATIGTDAHDVFAQDSILYVAEGSSPTIGIFDISTPSAPALLQRINVPAGGYVHNVWVSQDNHYMVTTEETAGKTVKLWDIQDPGNVSLLGEYLGGSELAHNAFIRDNYIFLSHYESGIKVVDISDPTRLVEVGYYDTYPQGETPNFNGVWGIYPFAKDNKLFVSDRTGGLFVTQFNGVRAGFIQGAVTDAVSGAALEGVRVQFLQNGNFRQTGSAGEYEFGTAEGAETVVFSLPGYFTDTLQVTVQPGSTVVLDAALEVNLADIGLSLASLELTLPADTVFSASLIVRNDGPSGRLDYMLRDVNGPLLTRQGESRPVFPGLSLMPGHNSPRPERVEQPVRFGNTVGDTIIIDPIGDLVLGSKGDIIAVYASVAAGAVTLEFEFLEPIDPDSSYLLLAVDTDFDVNTGAFPGAFGFNSTQQNIGSEFDMLVNVPALPALQTPANSISIWPGANTTPGSAPLYTGSITSGGNFISFTIPLSVLGNDDGNMLLAGFGGNLLASQNNVLISSLDFLPDVGNGLIGIDPQGDVPWISLSSTGGSLGGGESDTISVFIDTANLTPGESYSGFISVLSNDPDETELALPVSLLINPATGIAAEPLFPGNFELEQNYPNPFNPTTRLAYQLPQRARVNLAVYNLLGQQIRLLVNDVQSAGSYELEWDGRDANGFPVASSVYFYRMVAESSGETGGGFTATRKMILMR